MWVEEIMGQFFFMVTVAAISDLYRDMLQEFFWWEADGLNLND